MVGRGFDRRTRVSAGAPGDAAGAQVPTRAGVRRVLMRNPASRRGRRRVTAVQ
jgi:hypothetical protein